MRASWIRQLVGRGVLRKRLRRRACSVGTCPRCGSVLFGLTEDWLDAERVMSRHLEGCSVATPATTGGGAVRPMRRSA
jgi:hypothetical protein